MKPSKKTSFFLLSSLLFLLLSLFTLAKPNPIVAQTCSGIFDCCLSRDTHGNCTSFSPPFPCSGSTQSQCTSNPTFVCQSNYGVTPGNNGCFWRIPTPPPVPTSTPGPPPPPPPPGVTPTETPPPPPIIGSPRPTPYVPCSQVRTPEFHSLRPYQASPCNLGYEDLALFCGNDLIISDQVNISKNFFPYFAGWSYIFEGSQIDPVPPEIPILGQACGICSNGQCIPNPNVTFCLPDIGCEVGSSGCTETGNCIDNGDGTETCNFNVTRNRNIAVDLQGAYLPIMGFTEPSIGSEDRPDRVINSVDQSETMDDAEKANEYVSWYLHSIIGRAEYDPPDPDTQEGRSRIIDFSGPLKRLLAFSTQGNLRDDQQSEAGDTRHNQVVVCTNALGFPTHCYPPRAGVTQRRLTTTPTNDREYIPFSSTEDRLGRASFGSYSIQPALSSTFRILSSSITNQVPAPLFFAHMQEGAELGQTLQRLFAYEGADLEAEPEDWVASTSQFCDLRGIRSNPGDNLFAGEMSATVNYTAQVECEFAVYNPTLYPGNLCRRLSGDTANCTSAPDRGTYCETNYGQVDCASGEECTAGCVTLVDDTNCKSLPGPNPGCVPSDWTGGIGCAVLVSNYCNPSPQFKCVEDAAACSTHSYSQINLTQECPNNVQVAFRTVTESPLVDDVWKRLVANPVSVFRRIFPQIEDEEGRPITRLFDMPAATSVIYSGEGVTLAGNPASGRPANEAELYFPHIGGVHEYFLKCIQKTLRPQGYGEGCISGPEPLANLASGDCATPPPSGAISPGGGRCQPGTGFCSVGYLTPFFGSLAREASIICNMESGGNPNALNCGCFLGRSVDYSAGLFQINILAHCSGATTYTWSPPSCTVLDQSRVDDCLARFFDPEENAQYAANLRRGAGDWGAWKGSASICGLYP